VRTNHAETNAIIQAALHGRFDQRRHLLRYPLPLPQLHQAINQRRNHRLEYETRTTSIQLPWFFQAAGWEAVHGRFGLVAFN
jgi:deoxycytidylate deaminase